MLSTAFRKVLGRTVLGILAGMEYAIRAYASFGLDRRMLDGVEIRASPADFALIEKSFDILRTYSPCAIKRIRDNISHIVVFNHIHNQAFGARGKKTFVLNLELHGGSIPHLAIAILKRASSTHILKRKKFRTIKQMTPEIRMQVARLSMVSSRRFLAWCVAEGVMSVEEMREEVRWLSSNILWAQTTKARVTDGSVNKEST